MNITCDSNGSWSGLIPVCTYDNVTTEDDGREICQGKQPHNKVSGILCVDLFVNCLPHNGL